MKCRLLLVALVGAELMSGRIAQAQPCGGVADIAAAQGYSASPGMGMPIPHSTDTQTTPVETHAEAAPIAPRHPRVRTAVALHAPRHLKFRASDSIVAKAKRWNGHRRARVA